MCLKLTAANTMNHNSIMRDHQQQDTLLFCVRAPEP
jgi:hypothetical protein